MTTGASGNLLGSTWTFTPAASGSLSAEFDDGTPVPALEFAGVIAGDFDTYSQAISTVVGSTYSVDLTILMQETICLAASSLQPRA